MKIKCFYQTLLWLALLLSTGCQLPDSTLPPSSNECTPENPCESQPPVCGDGVVDEGETCDDGNTNTELCPYGETYCTICNGTCAEAVGETSFCGDASTDTENGEECDDGNTDDNDACTSACLFPLCGNGTLDDGEECDDGNDVDTDTCTNLCKLPQCGDGLVSATEECDDQNTINEVCEYGQTACQICSNECLLIAGVTSFCGDGITDSNNAEGCDQGASNGLPSSTCRTDCVPVACGDGNIDAGEECDEGNLNGAGSCNSACQHQPFILKDLNTEQTSDSNGYVVGKVNNILFVIGYNSTFQTLLYGYDMDTGVSEILSTFDIGDLLDFDNFRIGNALTTSSHLYLFTQLNATSYVWRSDGTKAGTTLLKTFTNDCGRNYSVCIGSEGTVLGLQIPEAEERIVFDGYDSIYGYGLWTSDGTLEGTQAVFANDSLNVRPITPESFVTFNNLAYFKAQTEATGEELWTTDGTPEGTQIVTQIIDGSGGTMWSLELLPSGIAFNARSDDFGYEPHFFNGSSVRMLANVHSNGGSYPHSFAQLGNQVCYIAEHREYGDEIFCSDIDNPAENYRLLKDIHPGDGSSYPQALAATDQRLYFFAESSGDDDYRLWTSDGTEEGTMELYSEQGGYVAATTYSQLVIPLGDKVYFHAIDSETNNPSIFVSEGTLASTERLANVETRPSNWTLKWSVFDHLLFFRANDTAHGFEPWFSDGTPSGTAMLHDFNPASNSAIPPATATRLGNKVFFVADANGIGTEPYVSDGTSEGTLLLRDINTGSESSYPIVLGVLNDQLIFSAYEPVSGRELWRTDGTVEGTSLIAEIIPGNSNTWLSYATQIQDTIYFAGEDLESVQLWKTDGTLVGTQKVKDIDPQSSSYPKHFTLFNEKIYFQARTQEHGKELWRTDGTESGTELFADIEPGNSGSYPSSLMATDSRLFFTAQKDDVDHILWSTDGNSVTELLRLENDLDDATVELYAIASYGDTFYFGATTENEGTELWSSNGTVEGTKLLIDFDLGPNSSTPYKIFQNDDTLWLSVKTENQGREIWSINLSDNSFFLLKDIAPGPKNGIPYIDYNSFNAITLGNDGYIYFAANNEDTGFELWRSDGTSSGTNLFSDLAPGWTSSLPGSLKSTEEFLFFRALDTELGYETWRYTFPENP